MSLSSGLRVGPYEILGPLGSGGMGEVYRARDARLGREVAIKVLPADSLADPDRLRRFEQESKAAGALNHPNLLAVFDTGRHEDAPYIVFELLQGETLRERLDPGPLTTRKAVDYAIQIAHGLAAAHRAGIVHRDLKPENVFVTEDGRVKILDFGLAKLRPTRDPDEARTDATTASEITDAGTVLGTASYMSPEQVQGLPADQRSDIFSFGSVFYEMLSGRRVFGRDSTIETMRAILKEEPAELAQANGNLPPALERIVRRCLEKQPEERFQSARDVGFALEALLASSGAHAKGLTAIEPATRWNARSALMAALLVTTALAMLALGRQTAKRPPTSFHRLTFRRGTNMNARFAPDGQTIVYGAAWDDKPIRLFTTRLDSPESREMDLPDADILSISSTSELAILLHRLRGWGWSGGPLEGPLGTLARVPMSGGAPRELLDDVQGADWSPDGKDLAVVHQVGERRRLEFPIGKVLYEADSHSLANPRVSPRGDLVGAITDVDGLIVVDRQGKKTTFKAGMGGMRNFAWSPKGDEIWFTAGGGSLPRLQAIDLLGSTRVISEFPGFARIEDVRRDGRALVTFGDLRAGMLAPIQGTTQERDLSWRNWSIGAGLSLDGRTLLFGEFNERATVGPAEKTVETYVRRTDGASAAIRLREGDPWDLSPDGRWALMSPSGSGSPVPEVALVPTGAGETKIFKADGIEFYGGGFFPDGKRVGLSGRQAGGPWRFYVQDLAGGPPRLFLPEIMDLPHMGFVPVSHDGRLVALLDPQGKITLYPIDGGQPRLVPGPPEPAFVKEEWDGLNGSGWSADDRAVFIVRNHGLTIDVFRKDIASGRRELWKQIRPADPAGILGLVPVFSADSEHYAYTYWRLLSDLSLVEGLR